MNELLRDTAFGKLVRVLNGHRILLYPEDANASERRACAWIIVVDSGPDDSEVKSSELELWEEASGQPSDMILTFAIYIGSAIYSPGIPGVATEFGVSTIASTLGLTLFVLGYGIGPMIWSPLSELPVIGRNPVYLSTLFAFILLNLVVVYAPNFGTLLAFRFITGLFGSPALATGGASMADI
ncbi:uncharacterized protein KD926_004369 [Aspergillus affinis]|uniref:uncharacterized protein n=1 Tax=Aspergillus affinis TaxID=1070780 RepID=UPI0022FF342E|nr:uncharacterized protein KD926_004369 [Aspergillus affinis]KAI9043186.1 hypothetical protein KD926_004369 [Aspergillus affinis]